MRVNYGLGVLREKIQEYYVLRSYLKPFEKTLRSKTYQYDAQNTICLFSDPRGGSTWMGELLQSMPNSALVDEPLWSGYYQSNYYQPPKNAKIKKLSKLNFFYYQPIPGDADWPEARDFFNDLFNLKFIQSNLFQETNLKDLQSAEVFLFKINHGKLLMRWLIELFPFKSIILTRHPCSVVSSQLEYYSFYKVKENPKFTVPNCKYHELFQRYAGILETISTPEENLAAIWAIGFLETTQIDINDKVLVVSYESLLKDPSNEWERLHKFLPSLPKEVPVNFSRVSQSSNSEGSVNPEEQLVKWRSKLSSDQVNNILDCVNKFGITTYGSSYEPDYSKLYNLTN